MRLSVIIPTLNEASALGAALGTLDAAAERDSVEVVVADCGSADDTAVIAKRAGARVVTGGGITNRARACNAGAAESSGDVLMFVHADSRVPARYDAMIEATVTTPGFVGGAFGFALDGPEWRLRVVELVNWVRFRMDGAYFGDQGIFVLREVFDAVGGFPDMGIMEDARFCGLARRRGRLRLMGAAMLTSPRRFYAGGILTTLMFDAVIWFWDLLGLDVSGLATRYRRDNQRRGRPEVK